jgi:hypothetical protein
LGFQTSKKVNNLVLEKRWPRNNTDVEDDPYETPTFAYNKEMDQLVVTNTFNRKVEKENITRPNDEEKSEGPKTTHPRDMTTNSDKEEEKINNTMVRNGFKRCQHHTKRNWFCSLCPT